VKASTTVAEFVTSAALAAPDRVALVAPGRELTTYATLAEQVARVVGSLRARGVEADHRVALLVETGPEAATGFLGIASTAICAPLNPSFRESELDFALHDLRARALVVSATLDTPARDVARRHGVEVVELEVRPGDSAGVFALAGAEPESSVSEARPEDVALLLHTSGTTARPKLVPLPHRQLVASARNVRESLGLREDDRCLNVMPLFHIHGLVAALLASLDARGSVICTPGFHQLQIFEWLREHDPTWTTAVPTMLQGALERMRRDPTLVVDHGLRFVRSSSAPLPVAVLEGLERALGVPVVEAYGMTEAAHQMASNPISGTRKPGSVGVPAGPEVTVLREDGSVADQGDVGEIAVRGSNVFAGYEANPEANAESFTNGWFRTGDLGRLDRDGYLFLVGRSKEIINRAGEKISPLEVDDVLLRHAAVEQAATFGVPDARLGEEVAAAVVVREGHSADERALQDFVAQTVAPFKVPRRIAIVPEIPRTATGKVQRTRLAEQLQLAEPGPRPAMSSGFLEEGVRATWAEVLGLPDVEPDADFFALGGDSILGAEAVARIRELIADPALPLITIVRAPTPRGMAAEVQSQYGWDHRGLVLIQEGSTAATTLFCIHGVDGDVVRFAPLARRLGDRWRVVGLRPGGTYDDALPDSVEGLATEYLPLIRASQPHGPYLVVGFCMGATVALELAHRLSADEEEVRIILIDPRLRRSPGLRQTLHLVRLRAREKRLTSAVLGRLGRRRQPTPGADDADPVTSALEQARDAYVPIPTSAPAAVLRSATFEGYAMSDAYISGVFTRIVFDMRLGGAHRDLFRAPAVVELEESIERACAALEDSGR
jgi:acyl-CoA synthetase (AMP-forming)/AMP-acid ligase II/thioesterase domain-containing protein